MSAASAPELLRLVRHTLHARALFEGAQRVLIACSGGPDSQALLHVLHALRDEHGCSLAVAGVDHGLRAEAPAELALAQQLASQLGLEFVVLRVIVADGASRQAQARKVRYAALLDHAQRVGAQRIAVGHTLDDQAETVLARLLRGSGLEGLGGAAPRRADGVVRPLIDAPRDRVHAYIRGEGIPFARDPSNRDERYLRVRVRHALLPALSAENPRIAEHLAQLADDAREAGELLAVRAESALARADGDVRALREEPSLVRRFALKREIERRTGAPLSRAHLMAVERMLIEAGHGHVRVPGDVVVSVGREGTLSLAAVTKRGRGSRRPKEPEGTK
ncbi:MAG TPA: tRNA lysidine(34) synthetase TilS [Polyangiales bacterium]|nr:tRNA lysidine(34) synthetase TilS [Polyangiales bacterium]